LIIGSFFYYKIVSIKLILNSSSLHGYHQALQGHFLAIDNLTRLVTRVTADINRLEGAVDTARQQLLGEEIPFSQKILNPVKRVGQNHSSGILINWMKIWLYSYQFEDIDIYNGYVFYFFNFKLFQLNSRNSIHSINDHFSHRDWKAHSKMNLGINTTLILLWSSLHQIT